MSHAAKRLFFTAIVCSTIAVFASTPETASEAAPQRPFMRGMTVSCPMYGAIWGSPEMAKTLDDLQGLGVTWVSIHPYAGVRRDGTIRVRETAAETGYLQRAAEMSRSAGVELFWKPHLAYWGSFEWRGDIEFQGDQEAWERFFKGYRDFIVDHARFAESAGVPLFAVGTELEATTHHEEIWREIVAEIRKVYSGKLTYAANWDRVDRVTFWDALDFIGVQAYFPLSHDPYPGRDAINAAWDSHIVNIREYSARMGKPILFTEIGYDMAESAAREPWETASRDTPANRELRRRLMAIALERIEAEPSIHGLFWWKWIPGQRSPRDFAMQNQEARDVLREYWNTAE